MTASTTPAPTPTQARTSEATTLAEPIPPLPVAPTITGAIFLATAATAAGLGLATVGVLTTPVSVACAAVGIAIAAGLTTTKLRARARQDITDRAAEALARRLGYRTPTRRSIHVRRWRGGWVGAPEKIAVHYGPAAPIDTPQWRRELTTTIGHYYSAEYHITKTSAPRRRLVLRRVHRAEGARNEVAERGESILLNLFGPTASVQPEISDDGDVTAFQVRHQASVKFSPETPRRRAGHAFNVNVPGQWRTHWSPETDEVRFTRRPVMPTRVDHPAPEVTDESRYRLPFGVDEDSASVVWDLRGSGPHLLVAGPTGSGKTVLINTLVEEATAAGREFKVRVVDPKRVEFLGLRGWPNVEIVATNVPDQVATIIRTWEEMEYRYQMVEDGLADESDFEPVVLVLDEYRDLQPAIDAWWQKVKQRGQPNKCPVHERVGSLARRGRTAGVHLILGTQRPDADFLTGEMRSNFTTRVSTGQLDPDGARMMWGRPYIGVTPPPVRGRAVAMPDSGVPVDVQVYWTPDPRRVGRFANDTAADVAIVDRLRPLTTAHQRMRPVFDQNDESGPLWDDIEAARWEPDTRPLVDYAAAGHTTTGPPVSAVATALAAGATPTPVEPSITDPASNDDDPDDAWRGYSESPQMVPVDDLNPGDLIRVDDDLDTWAVVQDCGPDLIDDAVVTVDWLDIDGTAGALQVGPDMQLACRRPEPSHHVDVEGTLQ